jgi:micrococcal nuclease
VPIPSRGRRGTARRTGIASSLRPSREARLHTTLRHDAGGRGTGGGARRRSRVAIALAALAALLPVLGTAPAAQARTSEGPCVAGTSGPLCHFWTARTTFVADGDTIRVVVDGEPGEKTIRFTGINAMELWRYSANPAHRRGACMGPEAAALVDRAIKASHGIVRLSAQDPGSRSGKRLRRSVEVRVGGRWQDLSRMELEQGLALWLPNGVEWAHNRDYDALAEEAAAAHRNLYDPGACAGAPSPDAQLAVDVNWDADGDDEHDLNGEWVDIRNLGPADVSLAGWWLRDSWLRFSSPHVPGFLFPSYAVVPAGGSVRLHAGCGENGPASPQRFFWCQKDSVFENANGKGDVGDGAYLFDPRGNLRASMIYPCVTACSDPLTGQVALDVHPTAPEAISVTNVGGGPVDLAGHLLKLHLDGEPSRFIWSYPFGAGSVLEPGETLEVHVDGSPGDDTRLERYLGRGPYRLADGGNVVSLRSMTDIVVACAAWGDASCQ